MTAVFFLVVSVIVIGAIALSYRWLLELRS